MPPTIISIASCATWNIARYIAERSLSYASGASASDALMLWPYGGFSSVEDGMTGYRMPQRGFAALAAPKRGAEALLIGRSREIALMMTSRPIQMSQHGSG